MFESFVNFIKPFVLFAITGIVSAFSPLHDVLYVLNIVFLLNIVMGIVTDAHVNKAKFKMRKFFEAIFHMMLFVSLIFITNETTTRMGDLEAGRISVKWLTYIVVYGYATNVLKNAHATWPNNRIIAFLYMLMSTEILTKLKELIGIKKETVTPFDPKK
ncbi:MAG TPA: hypothetical protein VIK55_19340 [Paludibacter sp.]